MVREKEQTFTPATGTNPLIFIRLVLAAGEAVSAPPLSATLGQVQINSNDFCKQFNAFSLTEYELGTLLNVHLFKNSDGTFFFKIRGIFLPFLLFQASVDHDHVTTRAIPLEQLFDIYRIQQLSIGAAVPKPMFNTAKQFFGGLRSSRFNILLLFCLCHFPCLFFTLKR